MKNLVSNITVENVVANLVIPALGGLVILGLLSLVVGIVTGQADLANASFGSL